MFHKDTALQPMLNMILDLANSYGELLKKINPEFFKTHQGLSYYKSPAGQDRLKTIEGKYNGPWAFLKEAYNNDPNNQSYYIEPLLVNDDVKNFDLQFYDPFHIVMKNMKKDKKKVLDSIGVLGQ